MAKTSNMIYMTTSNSLSTTAPKSTFYSATLQLSRMNSLGNTLIPAFNLVLYSNPITIYYPYRVSVIRTASPISLTSPYFATYVINSTTTGAITIDLPYITNLMVSMKLRFIIQSSISSISWRATNSGLILNANTSANPETLNKITTITPQPYTFIAIPNTRSTTNNFRPFVWQQI
jgi:hypothetical protein